MLRVKFSGDVFITTKQHVRLCYFHRLIWSTLPFPDVVSSYCARLLKIMAGAEKCREIETQSRETATALTGPGPRLNYMLRDDVVLDSTFAFMGGQKSSLDEVLLAEARGLQPALGSLL